MTGWPLRKAQRVVASEPWGGHRLHSILGAPEEPVAPTATIRDRPPAGEEWRSPFPTLAYLDATRTTSIQSSTGDVALHVLWAAPGSRPVLTVFTSPTEPIEYPCAPGDFLLVPAGRSFVVGEGIVAVIIGTGEVVTGGMIGHHSRPVLPPTHGLPVFSGFNRQTFGVATPTLALCRWKLTQPQVVPAPVDRPLWLSNLVEPVAVSWMGGMELLRRTEGCFLEPGASVTLLPNDLGYVLVAWVPQLSTEVVDLLRSAAYTNADIATLGVPFNSLSGN